MIKILTEAILIVIDQINSITINQNYADKNCHAVLIKIQYLLQEILYIIQGVSMNNYNKEDDEKLGR